MKYKKGVVYSLSNLIGGRAHLLRNEEVWDISIGRKLVKLLVEGYPTWSPHIPVSSLLI